MVLMITTTNPEETLKLGSHLGTLLKPGDFLNLNGDLGAGKTLLTKGIGLSLGLAADGVTSPTFAIINEYHGNYPLYHFDLYRLESEFELEQIGYLDYFYGDGITIAEWGNLFKDQLPKERLDIDLASDGTETRKITLVPRGSRNREIVKELRGLLGCTS